MTYERHKVSDQLSVSASNAWPDQVVVWTGEYRPVFIPLDDVRPLIAALRAAYNELYPGP